MRERVRDRWRGRGDDFALLIGASEKTSLRNGSRGLDGGGETDGTKNVGDPSDEETPRTALTAGGSTADDFR